MRPYHHAGDHTWDGEDPIPVVWHDLTLENGWTDVGSPKPPARYAIAPGRDPATGEPKIELELSVQGGIVNSRIALLPFTFAFDKPPVLVPDATGSPHVITILADGSIMDGLH